MTPFEGFALVGQYYTGVDPSHPDKVYYNRPNEPNQGDGWEQILFTPHSDGTWDAAYEVAGKQLSLQPDGSLQTRPLGTFGPFEQFEIRVEDDTQRILLYRADAIGAVLIVQKKS